MFAAMLLKDDPKLALGELGKMTTEAISIIDKGVRACA